MKSYNCFYSALFEVLEEYFGEKTHLLINNRWQFFLRKDSVYTDDKRMIGEWPMLYDRQHLYKLYEKIGISIIITNCLDNSINTFLKNQKSSVMMFVNKINLLHNTSLKLEHKCVSTVIVKKRMDQFVYCQTFDNELEPFKKIGVEVLYHAWKAASDYERLNQCHICIEYVKGNRKCNIEEFAKICMKYSLIHYLTQNNVENIYLGNAAMKMFLEEIAEWKKDNFKELIDCSMYMDILIKQRILFAETLKKLVIKNKVMILEKLSVLIEKWKNVKMLFYIIGMRRQRGAMNQLYYMFHELIDLELEVTCKLLESIQ